MPLMILTYSKGDNKLMFPMMSAISAWMFHKLGMDIFYLINCFFVYSFLGWIFECIVISYEEKTPVNRGFIRGPFCTIYGVGALGTYFLFLPISNNKILLFFLGAVLATTFEFLVAKLMVSLFGDFWWDYKNKPFNYKGVVCLESTVCWGVMTMLLFVLFQPLVEKIVNTYYFSFGRSVAIIILIVYALDFSTSFYKAYEAKEQKEDNLLTADDEPNFEFIK